LQNVEINFKISNVMQCGMKLLGKYIYMDMDNYNILTLMRPYRIYRNSIAGSVLF